MSGQTYKIDDAPLNKFHIKITALTFGSNFSDGYALGIIGIALTLLGPQMKLGAWWQGLLGSSALIGLFIGSLLLGRLSDRIGRQKIYLLNFLVITIASLLQFFVNGPVELFVLRIIIGIALGGDYAVGSTLLAEFAPKKYRGFLLGALNVLWTIGYVVASFVGYYLANSGSEAWRWMLVSSAVPAIIVLILRIGTPESPRWLISKGQVQKARDIVKKFIGPNAEIDENVDTEVKSGFKILFTKAYRKRTAFGGIFYVCNVIPYFAIYTFLPQILKTMGYTEDFTVDTVLNIFLMIGAGAGIWFMEKYSRRGFTIWSFAFLAISLFLLSVIPNQIVALICFVLFTFMMSANSNLTLVYPAELFPTEVRASGVGMVTAISRVGSAIGTFLLPVTMEGIGFTASMIILAVVLLIGTVVSMAWAPETKELNLNDASNPEAKAGANSSPVVEPTVTNL